MLVSYLMGAKVYFKNLFALALACGATYAITNHVHKNKPSPKSECCAGVAAAPTPPPGHEYDEFDLENFMPSLDDFKCMRPPMPLFQSFSIMQDRDDFQSRERAATMDKKPHYDSAQTQVCWTSWSNEAIARAICAEFVRVHSNNLYLINSGNATPRQLFKIDRLFCNLSVSTAYRTAYRNLGVAKKFQFLGGELHENNLYTLNETWKRYPAVPNRIVAEPASETWTDITQGSLIILSKNNYFHTVAYLGTGYVSQYDNRVWVPDPYGKPVVASFYDTKFEYLEYYRKNFDTMHVINMYAILAHLLNSGR
ncbi:MAG: hypothetical protein FWE52_00040 [Alphaproteobacteria bacterium]|nr:hypothetical protein [Alphaproteobacteria bacterium]